MENMDRPRPTLDDDKGVPRLSSRVCWSTESKPGRAAFLCTSRLSTARRSISRGAVLISRCGHTFIEHKQIGTELCRPGHG